MSNAVVLQSQITQQLFYQTCFDVEVVLPAVCNFPCFPNILFYFLLTKSMAESSNCFMREIKYFFNGSE